MDFHSLPRRELQALCKKNRIPANMTNVAMADALHDLSSVEGMEELQAAMAAAQFLSPQKPEATAGAEPPRTSRRTTARKLPAASVEPKEQQASPLPRSRRVTVKTSEIMRLISEGEGDKDEQEDLAAEQVVPQTPAAIRAEETASKTTRRRTTRKEEVGADGGMDAITNKTPATRTAGRRTTTRRAAATSAPLDEVKEEQMVAPSRTTRRTRQATKPPAGDSIAATATLRRSTRARGGVSKMAPLAPEEGHQMVKDVEAVDSLDLETKLEDSDVVQENNNSAAEICPAIADDGNQILEEVEDEKQEHSVGNKDAEIQDDDILADNKFSEVLEEKMEESSESCGTGHVEVFGVIQEEAQVAEVEAIFQGEEEINQEFSEISDQVCVEVFGVTQQEEQGVEVEAFSQGEDESNQADDSLSGLEGSPVLGLVSSFVELVISEDKQGVQDEDKSLVLLEAKDANADLLVGEELEVSEKLSPVDFVNNEDVAIDAVADPLMVHEAENGNVSLEEVRESLAAILVEGSSENPDSLETSGDESAKISAEKASMIKGEAFAEVENATEKHDLAFEAEEEFDTGCVNNVKGVTESEKKLDLNECSLRKLKYLFKVKMSKDNQKVDKKRPALSQLDENCLQHTSEE